MLNRRIFIMCSFIAVSCAERSLEPIDVSKKGSSSDGGNEFGSGESGFGNGSLTKEDGAIDYPKLTYYGSGNLETRAGNSNLFLTISVEMDQEKIQVKTTNTRSNDDNSDVRDGVRSNDGLQVLKRADSREVSDLVKAGDLPESNMFMYVSNLKKKDGRLNTFSTPIPFVIVPKSKADFEKFKSTSISPISTTVSGAFNGTLQVSVQPGSVSNDTQESIRIIYAIQGINHSMSSAEKGLAYQNLGLPAQVDYVVDTEKRRIVRMSNINTFFEDDNDSWPVSNIKMDLCEFESTTSGVESLGACQ